MTRKIKNKFLMNPESMYFILIILLVIMVLFLNYNADKYQCKEPKIYIGNRCCLPYEKDNTMCREEGELFEKKILKSINDGRISQNDLLVNKNPNFSFVSPRDYYVVNDIIMGGQRVPFFFLKSLSYNNSFCTIRVTTIHANELIDKNISNLTNYFLEIFEDANVYRNVNVKLYVNNKGTEGYFVEYMDIQNNNLKSAFYEDAVQKSFVVFTFGCSIEDKNYETLISEFNEVVSSFSFG